ncbi:hypothetical protein F5888DRAFT_1637977 [Russula emetica]|nr:hypothetical protein F5888DRAFT_1637977 [Russula emetica]
MVQVPTIKPLSAENVLWANTMLAAGSAIGFVVYTGPETCAVMNTSHLQTKVGLLDHEISHSPRFRGFWYIYVFRFLILFSSIIPISLALCHNVTPVTNDDGSVTYQASSPDEVAIVNWTSSVGLTLTFHDRTRIELRTPSGTTLAYDVLEIFPLHPNLSVWAPLCTIQSQIVQRNDWLKEDMAK